MLCKSDKPSIIIIIINDNNNNQNRLVTPEAGSIDTRWTGGAALPPLGGGLPDLACHPKSCEGAGPHIGTMFRVSSSRKGTPCLVFK